MENIEQLKKTYAVSLERYGKYVEVEESYGFAQVVMKIADHKFRVGQRYDPRCSEELEMVEVVRIMFCEALNVMYILENEGIDTSEAPEMNFKDAVLKPIEPPLVVKAPLLLRNGLGTICNNNVDLVRAVHEGIRSSPAEHVLVERM